MKANDSIIEWLSTIKGRFLSRVNAVVYSYNHEPEIDHAAIEALSLEFDGISPSRIKCNIDGVSLCCDSEKLNSFSMEEFGEMLTCNISSSSMWKKLIGRKLSRIYTIESTVEESLFSIQLIFEGECSVFISNLGDNLVVSQQLSSNILEEERAKITAI